MIKAKEKNFFRWFFVVDFISLPCAVTGPLLQYVDNNFEQILNKQKKMRKTY